MKKHSIQIFSLIIFFFLTVSAQKNDRNNNKLQNLFKEWRSFEIPPNENGAPDYKKITFDKRFPEFLKLKSKLCDIDKSILSTEEEVDWTLIWAEMNGYLFNYKVLKPWERDPAFYKTIWTSRSDVSAHEGPSHHNLVELWKYKFPLSADRGLCGGFNTNIVKKAREFFNQIIDANKKLKIITVGSKGDDQIKRNFKDYIVEKISYKNIKNISLNEASELTSKIITMFENNEFDVCTIFYNKFKSVISQKPQAQQIIPVENLDADVENSEDEDQYEFEPDENEILEYLLPQNITTQLYKAFLENAASEQGSRMSAMDNATRNAGDLIDKLTINYNRSRQAVITKELIEIISGAESL